MKLFRDPRQRIYGILGLIVLTTFVFAWAVVSVYFGRNSLPDHMLRDRELIVLTHQTFVSSTGAGGLLVKNFEREQGIKIKVVTVPDSGWLKVRHESMGAVDLVIGLDQWQALEYGEHPPFRTAGQMAFSELQWDRYRDLGVSLNEVFVPLNWSPLTFISEAQDKGGGLEGLTLSSLKDPRFHKAWIIQQAPASHLALHLLIWLKALDGALAQRSQYASQIQIETSTWTESYFHFQKKPGSWVMTYLTSLAYHLQQEPEKSWRYVLTPMGHPVQVETVSISNKCRECDMAEMFLASLTTRASQTLLMQRNYMLPVWWEGELSPPFSELPDLPALPRDVLPQSPSQISDLQTQWSQ